MQKMFLQNGGKISNASITLTINTINRGQKKD